LFLAVFYYDFVPADTSEHVKLEKDSSNVLFLRGWANGRLYPGR